jgi:hypothetical protein
MPLLSFYLSYEDDDMDDSLLDRFVQRMEHPAPPAEDDDDFDYEYTTGEDEDERG